MGNQSPNANEAIVYLDREPIAEAISAACPRS